MKLGMSDKITLDFENNTITFDTENQKGTEYYENLYKLKDDILKILGYERIDMSSTIDFINYIINEDDK